MALNTNKIPATTKSNFVAQPALEAGVYPARVVQILDLGLQPQRPYRGQEKPPAYQIQMTYELVDVFMVDENGDEMEDKPRWISETFPVYNLEQDKAKSTLRYMALDPQQVHGGDFSLLTDTPCNVTVVINQVGDKVYTNVANVSTMRPRDAAKCPELVNEPAVFDLSNPDLEVYNKLPEWLRTKIAENLEYRGSKLEKLLGGKVVEEEEEEVDEPPFDTDDDDETSPY